MPPIQPPNLQPEDYDWEREGNNRLDLEWLDVAYLDQYVKKTHSQLGHAPEEADKCLKDFLDIPACLPQGTYKSFNAICPETHLAGLSHDTICVTDEPAVWMHDRDAANNPRDYNGVMGPQTLMKNLKLKRFGEPGLPDAQTRRIYAPHPDKRVIGPLILRAPQQSQAALRELVQRHIDADALFEVKCSEDECTYRMEFHLPYVRIMESKELKKDNRKKVDGEPVRSSKDVSFLFRNSEHKDPEEGGYFLYESQRSFVIFGSIASRWTAINLADIYMHDDPTNANMEDMLPYYECQAAQAHTDSQDSQELADSLDDPLTIGKFTADCSPSDSREYFALVLKAQVEHCRAHWHDTLQNLRGAVSKYLKNPDLPLLRSPSTLGTVAGESALVEKSERWVTSTSELLAEVTRLLKKNIAAWESFTSEDMQQITNSIKGIRLKRINQSLRETKQFIADMDRIRRDLEDLQERVKIFKARVQLHLGVNDNRTIELQHWHVMLLQISTALPLATTMQNTLGFQPSLVCYALYAVVAYVVTITIKPLITGGMQLKSIKGEAASNNARFDIRQLFTESGILRPRITWPSRGSQASREVDLGMGNISGEV